MGIREIDWRGPRPLKPGDELIGRKRERIELRSRCESYDIVQVTAPSGVGKTSFINAGGIPALHEAGYHVPVIKPWSELHGHPLLRRRESTDEYAQILYRLIVGAPEDQLDPSDGRTPGEVVKQVAAGEPMVVVIDQTEELLRYQGAVGRALLQAAGEAALASTVPHVIIARSEYREGLRPAEVRGTKIWNLYLDEISSEKALAEIVAKPARDAGVALDDAVVEQLIRWWANAKAANVRTQGAGSELIGGVGLLHLQSLLWSLKRWATTAGLSDAITQENLTEFAGARARERGFSLADADLVGGRLIEDAIVSYVQEQVELATAAPTISRDGTDRELAWANGPRLLLARFAPALSSGGYKVAQALSSLVPLALGDELTQRTARELAEQLREGSDLDGWVKEKKLRLTGAGVAVDWTPGRMIAEMIDALESILQSLSSEEANILRVYNVTEEPVYELVHDGVGPALTKWSQAFLERPVSAVGVISAQAGAAFGHELSPEVFTASGKVEPHWGTVSVTGSDEDAQATVENLRWASNFIGRGGDKKLAFKNVTFRGCDFAGAAFVGCALHEVTFEACTFRGAVMIACEMEGVSFVPDPDHGDELNLLTLVACTALTPVRMKGLSRTTGLVFDGLAGGNWEFHDCHDIRHVVVSGRSETENTVRFVDSDARHVTVEAPVRTEVENSELVYEELGS